MSPELFSDASHDFAGRTRRIVAVACLASIAYLAAQPLRAQERINSAPLSPASAPLSPADVVAATPASPIELAAAIHSPSPPQESVSAAQVADINIDLAVPERLTPPETRVIEQTEQPTESSWKFWLTEDRTSGDGVDFVKRKRTYYLNLKLAKRNDRRNQFYDLDAKLLAYLLTVPIEERTTTLRVVIVPDPVVFEEVSAPVAETRVGLEQLRRDLTNSAALNQEEPETEGLRNERGDSITIGIQPDALRGTSAVTFLVLSDGNEVLQELVVPVCVAERCEASDVLPTLLHDTTAHTAGLTFVEAQNAKMIGIFWRPEGVTGSFHVWEFSFAKNAGADEWLMKLAGMFEKERVSVQQVGVQVLGDIFPSGSNCRGEAACARARAAFEQWAGSRRDSNALTPSTFSRLAVRLLRPARPRRALPELLPLSYLPIPPPVEEVLASAVVDDRNGIVADDGLPGVTAPKPVVRRRFLGDDVFVYMPTDDRKPTSPKCISRWWVVGPSKDDTKTSVAYSVLEDRRKRWSADTTDASKVYNDISLNVLRTPTVPIGGLIVISHFDGDGLYAVEGETSNSVIPLQIGVSLDDPAFVMFLACETGIPRNNELLATVHTRGARSIVATHSLIPAAAAGAFVLCFEDQLSGTVPQPLSDVFAKTIQCMARRGMHDASLSFAVLGDPALRLCAPGGS